jgi:DNA-binding transcriptional LysR family regulator
MAGEIRIGCTPILAASLVSAVVERLSRRYPRIVFHFMTAYLEPLRRELSERNVDLLIVPRFVPTADERMDFEPLFDDSFAVAAGAQNPSRLSSHNRGDRFPPSAGQSRNDWALCHNLPSLGIGIVENSLRNQGPAGRSANGPRDKCNRYREESHPQPRRSTIH